MRNAPLSIFSYKHVFLFCAHDCLGGASPSRRFLLFSPPVSSSLFLLLRTAPRSSLLPPACAATADSPAWRYARSAPSLRWSVPWDPVHNTRRSLWRAGSAPPARACALRPAPSAIPRRDGCASAPPAHLQPHAALTLALPQRAVLPRCATRSASAGAATHPLPARPARQTAAALSASTNGIPSAIGVPPRWLATRSSASCACAPAAHALATAATPLGSSHSPDARRGSSPSPTLPAAITPPRAHVSR